MIRKKSFLQRNYFNFFLCVIGFHFCLHTLYGEIISNIRVEGEEETNVYIDGNLKESKSPNFSSFPDFFELKFIGVELNPKLKKTVEILSPNKFIKKVLLQEVERKIVVVQIFPENKIERISENSTWVSSKGYSTLKIRFTNFYSHKEKDEKLRFNEDKLLSVSQVSDEKKELSKINYYSLIFTMIALIFFTVFVALFLKKMSNKFNRNGSRRYLIEVLSYCPIGSDRKTGVGLIKVGNEFCLIGVTANQISHLSSLPKLAMQYEEENQFEQSDFKEAMREGIKSEKKLTVEIAS